MNEYEQATPNWLKPLLQGKKTKKKSLASYYFCIASKDFLLKDNDVCYTLFREPLEWKKI